MDSLMLTLVACGVGVVVVLTIGIAFLITQSIVESNSRILLVKQSIDALGDWQSMHAEKLRTLQANFTKLVYRQDRELWKKLGLTEPAEYKKFKDSAEKMKIHFYLSDASHEMLKEIEEILLRGTGSKPFKSESKDHPGVEIKMKIDPEDLRPKFYPEEEPCIRQAIHLPKGLIKQPKEAIPPISKYKLRALARFSDLFIGQVKTEYSTDDPVWTVVFYSHNQNEWCDNHGRVTVELIDWYKVDEDNHGTP
jgi:hypothetical protein